MLYTGSKKAIRDVFKIEFRPAPNFKNYLKKGTGLNLKMKTSLKGFTMIETLVVATIFSIIALGLGTAFVSGMKIWDRARNWAFDRTMFMLDLETISADLRQSVDSPGIGFEGDSIQISFPMLSGNSIVRVTYSFDAEAKGLSRRQIDIKYISESEEEQEKKYTEKKFAGWEDFALSYLYYDSEKEGLAWSAAWLKEKGIFTAVKLEAKFKGEQFVKTVFIPIS